MGNIGQLMRQAQQMQEQMQKAQAELGTVEVTGESGGGLVKVTMNGRRDVRRVQIDPKLTGDDRDMLEDLIAAAVNDAVHKVEAAIQQKLAGMMGGMQLPAGLKLPL